MLRNLGIEPGTFSTAPPLTAPIQSLCSQHCSHGVYFIAELFCFARCRSECNQNEKFKPPPAILLKGRRQNRERVFEKKFHFELLSSMLKFKRGLSHGLSKRCKVQGDFLWAFSAESARRKLKSGGGGGGGGRGGMCALSSVNKLQFRLSQMRKSLSKTGSRRGVLVRKWLLGMCESQCSVLCI